MQDALRFAHALLYLDLQPGDAVGIMGFNSPEWVLAAVGTILAGGVTVGVYATSGPDSCRHIAQHARLRVVVCEARAHAEAFLGQLSDLPLLQLVVLYGEAPSANSRLDRPSASPHRVAVGSMAWRVSTKARCVLASLLPPLLRKCGMIRGAVRCGAVRCGAVRCGAVRCGAA